MSDLVDSTDGAASSAAPSNTNNQKPSAGDDAPYDQTALTPAELRDRLYAIIISLPGQRLQTACDTGLRGDQTNLQGGLDGVTSDPFWNAHWRPVWDGIFERIRRRIRVEDEDKSSLACERLRAAAWKVLAMRRAAGFGVHPPFASPWGAGDAETGNDDLLSGTACQKKDF